MSDDQVQATFFEINFDEISALAGVGVRRASVFLKMGLVACDNPPSNLALDGGITYRFMSDPRSEEEGERLRDEYRAWIVGCGLKELDHYFSLFLDRVWLVAELVSLHGARVHSSYEFDQKFQQITNVARKLEAVADRIAIQIELDSFHSLSLARNSLTHAAGVVRERDTNLTSTLEISWVAPVLVLLDGDKEIVYRSEPADTHRVESKEGAQLILRFDRHTASFAPGQRIRLSPHNLAEICAFYNIAAAKVLEGLKKAISDKGIPKSMPVTSEPT